MLKNEIGEIVSESCVHSNGICTCTLITTRPEAICAIARSVNNEEIDKKIAKLRDLQAFDFEAQIAALEAKKH